MNDYIILMHADVAEPETADQWASYLAMLRASGAFEGGSAIGAGETMRKDGRPAPASDHLTGYIRVRAETMAAAKLLVAGNPVFDCGGSVEIRELPRA